MNLEVSGVASRGRAAVGGKSALEMVHGRALLQKFKQSMARM